MSVVIGNITGVLLALAALGWMLYALLCFVRLIFDHEEGP